MGRRKHPPRKAHQKQPPKQPPPPRAVSGDDPPRPNNTLPVLQDIYHRMLRRYRTEARRYRKRRTKSHRVPANNNNRNRKHSQTIPRQRPSSENGTTPLPSVIVIDDDDDDDGSFDEFTDPDGSLFWKPCQAQSSSDNSSSSSVVEITDPRNTTKTETEKASRAPFVVTGEEDPTQEEVHPAEIEIENSSHAPFAMDKDDFIFDAAEIEYSPQTPSEMGKGDSIPEERHAAEIENSNRAPFAMGTENPIPGEGNSPYQNGSISSHHEYCNGHNGIDRIHETAKAETEPQNSPNPSSEKGEEEPTHNEEDFIDQHESTSTRHGSSGQSCVEEKFSSKKTENCSSQADTLRPTEGGQESGIIAKTIHESRNGWLSTLQNEEDSNKLFSIADELLTAAFFVTEGDGSAFISFE